MKKICSIIALSLLLFTSCEDELDINTNPNTPPNIDKGLAFSAAEASVATLLGGELFNLGGMYAQYFTQAPSAGQYDEIEKYNLSTDFANDLWAELYAGALNDLQFVQERSLEDGDTASNLMATVLRAYTFQYIVDLFGDVPYSEALQGNENISPQPTSGQEIYISLLGEIDAALEAYENSPVESGMEAQDLIFGGDVERWIEFANTLKLKIFIRMSYTSQANSQVVTALLNENNFLTEDADFAVFSDVSGKRHPYYEVQIERFGDINAVASNSLLRFLELNEDPRLEAIYKPNDDGEYLGLDQGLGLSPTYGGYLANNFARPRILPDTPVYFMTVAESQFLQAEAALRYTSESEAAIHYNQGVIASFKLYGIPDSMASNLLEGAYAFKSGSDQEEMLKQIIVQKWVSLANVNNIEAWIETIRTGYPELTTAEDPMYQDGRRIVSLASILPGGSIPLSLYYPDEEVQRNVNLDQKESLLTKTWWNQK